MNRRYAAALAVIALLFGGGLFAYRSIFSDSSSDAVKQDEAVTATTTPTDTTDAGNTEAEPSPYRVVEVKGRVQRRAESGEWTPVSAGDELPSSESLRTDQDSEATVTLGNDAELTLPEASGLTIEDGEGETARLRLDYGKASVRIPHAEASVKMRFKDSDAEARAKGASFTAQNDGEGQLAVLSDEGVVQLTAAGSTIEIPKGHQSLVEKAKPPSTPRALPSTLFLKVNKPRSLTRKKEITVAGSTLPGSTVTIRGVRTRANAKGEFSVEVPLEEGKNDLDIVAIDIKGRREENGDHSVRVDSKPPKVKGDVDW